MGTPPKGNGYSSKGEWVLLQRGMGTPPKGEWVTPPKGEWVLLQRKWVPLQRGMGTTPKGNRYHSKGRMGNSKSH